MIELLQNLINFIHTHYTHQSSPYSDPTNTMSSSFATIPNSIHMPGLINGNTNIYQDSNTSGSTDFSNSFPPLQLSSPVTNINNSPNFVYTNSKLPTSFQFQSPGDVSININSTSQLQIAKMWKIDVNIRNPRKTEFPIKNTFFHPK